jgi:hypothetical protein
MCARGPVDHVLRRALDRRPSSMGPVYGRANHRFPRPRRRRHRRLPVPRLPHAAGTARRRYGECGAPMFGVQARFGWPSGARAELSRQPLGGAGCDRPAAVRADRGGGQAGITAEEMTGCSAFFTTRGAGHRPTGVTWGIVEGKGIDRVERPRPRHDSPASPGARSRRPGRRRAADSMPDARGRRGGGGAALGRRPPPRAPGRAPRRVMTDRCDVRWWTTSRSCRTRSGGLATRDSGHRGPDGEAARAPGVRRCPCHLRPDASRLSGFDAQAMRLRRPSCPS